MKARTRPQRPDHLGPTARRQKRVALLPPALVLTLLFVSVGLRPAAVTTGSLAPPAALAQAPGLDWRRSNSPELGGEAARPQRTSGAPHARTSVVGGELAQAGTFPFMAFITDQRGEEEIACSGTVVAPNLVLTAAHCAVNVQTGGPMETSGYQVVTGAVNWTSPERQLSKVSRILLFPRYSLSGRSAGFGDAALLVLSTPTTAPAIRLASTANAPTLRTGTHALIVGWGETYYGQLELTESLNWARTVLEGNRCEGLPGRICAIDFPKFESGVCHGDSGGPLLAAGPRGQGLIEIGIAQAVFGNCLTTRPGIFTRADLVSAWVGHWISTPLAPP